MLLPLLFAPLLFEIGVFTETRFYCLFVCLHVCSKPVNPRDPPVSASYRDYKHVSSPEVLFTCVLGIQI